MKVIIEAEKEKINTILNQVRELKENFLIWAVDNESPAKYPEDLLCYLRTFNDVDTHFCDIMKKLWDAEK
jgi:hypothetical protein